MGFSHEHWIFRQKRACLLVNASVLWSFVLHQVPQCLRYTTQRMNARRRHFFKYLWVAGVATFSPKP